MNIRIIVVAVTFLLGCSESSTELFKDELTNEYRIQNESVAHSTPRAFRFGDTFNPIIVWLTDGDFENTLTTCCSTSNYVSSPSTVSRIIFHGDNDELRSGRYSYKLGSGSNDFKLSITNNMNFEELSDGRFREVSFDFVAVTNEGSAAFTIVEAEADLSVRGDFIEVDYKAVTRGAGTIIGSFSGVVQDLEVVNCQMSCN